MAMKRISAPSGTDRVRITAKPAMSGRSNGGLQYRVSGIKTMTARKPRRERRSAARF